MIGKVIEYATNYKWHMFPVEPRGKRPIQTGGTKDNGDVFRLRWGQCATNDINILRRWWRQWPDANIGLACKRSGLVIIDADVDGLQDWTLFCADRHLPETVMADTPSGGCHIIYKAVEGVTIGNRDLMRGVNVRGIKGDGGYVVIAPSIHPNGKIYSWSYGFGPDEIEIATLPQGLIEALKPKPIEPKYIPLPVRTAVGETYQERYALKQLDWKISDVRSAQNGHKHNTLNTSAYILGQFVGLRLLTEHEVRQSLLSAAVQNGFKDIEAERVINDGLRSGERDKDRLIIPTLTDVRLRSIRQAVSHGG